jgi:hypothetical protein
VADRPDEACTEASELLASSIPSAIPLCVLCALCGETVVVSAAIEVRRVAQYRPHSLRDGELMRRTAFQAVNACEKRPISTP